MTEDPWTTWTTFRQAVPLVMEQLGCKSVGRARSLVYQACESGEVRWAADDGVAGRSASARDYDEFFLDKADLVDWLERHVPPAPASRSIPMSRDVAIDTRLRAGERPGKTVSWKAFFRSVRKDCGTTAGTRGFSDDTIKRHVLKRR
jgi:hypothetical protein